MTDYAKVRAILDAATPGPWTSDLDIFDFDDPVIEACVTTPSAATLFTAETDYRAPKGPADPMWEKVYQSPQMADARAIVLEHNLAPELLAVAEAAERVFPADRDPANDEEVAISGYDFWAVRHALDALYAKMKETLT